ATRGVEMGHTAIIFRATRGVGPRLSVSDPDLPRPGRGDPSMWITPAYAQASPASEIFAPSSPIWMMVIVFVIMYVLMIRPQQKRVKQHQEMVKNLRGGARVLTSGGTVGRAHQ